MVHEAWLGSSDGLRCFSANGEKQAIQILIGVTTARFPSAFLRLSSHLGLRCQAGPAAPAYLTCISGFGCRLMKHL